VFLCGPVRAGLFLPLKERTDMNETEETVEETAVLSGIEKVHYDEIKSLNLLVNEACNEHDIKKHEAKAAKDHLEGLQHRLSQLISEGPRRPDPQKELPFEEWQNVPISDVLNLTPKQLEKLDEAGVKTAGQFENLRAGKVDGYPDGLRSVKGFGDKTIDAMEEDMVNWLAANAREEEPCDSAE